MTGEVLADVWYLLYNNGNTNYLIKVIVWVWDYVVLYMLFLLCILGLIKISSTTVNNRTIWSMCVNSNSNNNKKYRYWNNNSYKYNIQHTTSRETATEKVDTGPTKETPTVTRTGRDKSTTGIICIIEQHRSQTSHILAKLPI